MPVVPRTGPHPFAKPLIVLGVKRPSKSPVELPPATTKKPQD